MSTSPTYLPKAEPAPTFAEPQCEYEDDCIRTAGSQTRAVIGLILIAAGTAAFAGSILVLRVADRLIASERASIVTRRLIGLLLLLLLSAHFIIG